MNKSLRWSALALAAAALLGACGGSENDTSVQAETTRVYVMGDSLADSGTFGLKFTTQTSNAAGQPILQGSESTRLWVDYIAANATVNAQPYLCAAFSINADTGAATPNAGCTNFAIAGAVIGASGGRLSVPAQMQNAVRVTGGFRPSDLILVDGGGNDMAGLISRIAAVSGGSQAVGQALAAVLAAPDLATAQAALQPLATALAASGSARDDLVSYFDSVLGAGAAQAKLPPSNAAAAQAALQAMTEATDLATVQTVTRQLAASLNAVQGQTGPAVAELSVAFGAGLAGVLADAVQNQLLANGGPRVAVLNLPAVLSTPRLAAARANATLARVATASMQAYNQRLQQRLAAMPQALHIDFYSEFEAQVAAPEQYGLGNVTEPVCGSESTTRALASCTLQARARALGLSEEQLRNTFYPQNAYDASGRYYTFADPFHPTAVAHQRISQLVSRELAKRGWL
ncbi:MAG: SGNH/GDSL hydrolase family protein [Comamonadaceae bacterium]|nr:SGNH/GDSL hydrolase family protein [Comamonadaceae bacterium]